MAGYDRSEFRMILSRRSLFAGASALLAAPAIVRVASLMPVSVLDIGSSLTLADVIRAKNALAANDAIYALTDPLYGFDVEKATRHLLAVLKVPEDWLVPA